MYKWSPPWLRKAPWLPWLPPSSGLGKSCLRRPGRHHSPWAKHLLGCLASKVQQIQNSGSEPMPGCLLWVKLKHRSDKHHYFRCAFILLFDLFGRCYSVNPRIKGSRPKAQGPNKTCRGVRFSLATPRRSWKRLSELIPDLHPNYS